MQWFCEHRDRAPEPPTMNQFSGGRGRNGSVNKTIELPVLRLTPNDSICENSCAIILRVMRRLCRDRDYQKRIL